MSVNKTPRPDGLREDYYGKTDRPKLTLDTGVWGIRDAMTTLRNQCSRLEAFAKSVDMPEVAEAAMKAAVLARTSSFEFQEAFGRYCNEISTANDMVEMAINQSLQAAVSDLEGKKEASQFVAWRAEQIEDKKNEVIE